MSTPITILDLALHRGAKAEPDGSINGAEFARVGLPLFGGCELCHASIAAYNACPSHSGYLRCTECIGSTGWTSVERANREIFEDEEQ